MTTPSTPEAPEATQHEKWRMVVAKSAGEARQGTAPILAATGLIVWAIQYYGFNNRVPIAVSSALYILVPAAIGWISTHVAFRKVTL